MRLLLVLTFGLFLGALASSAFWLARGPRPQNSGPARPSSGESHAGSAAQVGSAGPTARRLTAIERELGVLSTEIAQLRGLLAGSGDRLPVAPDESLAIDGRALAAALLSADEERERERVESLTDEQLLAEARRRGKEDPLAEQELLESLLARPLAPDRRAQALAYLGVLHRKGGGLLDSELALQEAAALGAGTDAGAWATYELATTIAESGDPDRALELVLPVVSTPGISDWNRLHAEWITASLQAQTGDVQGARSRYEHIAQECAGTEFDWLAKKATHQLQATQ